MRTVDEPILHLIVVPVAAPAVFWVEAFPVVAEDLDALPVQAEAAGEEDVEVHGQALQVLTVESLGQAGVVEALLFLGAAPGVAEGQAEAHDVGVLDKFPDVVGEDLLSYA